jgi:predicted enzyme related to lactoylglutathione lyase
MLNFNSILIFSENPKPLAEFYKKVFVVKPAWEMEGYTTFELGKGYITIGPHDEVKGKSKDAKRIMFNLETGELLKEFERIKKLDVKVIKEPEDPDKNPEGGIATFEDPDGNYFQLVSPWKE